ncbi:MAG: Xaa-Pro peptidase family protein [Bryobacteraceae bacterium]
MIPATEYGDRRRAVAAALAAHRVDALLVTSLPNVRYLTGFTGSNAILLLEPTRATLYTDPRYGIQAREETICRINVSRGPTRNALIPRLKRIKRVGFDPVNLTVATHSAWAEAARLRPVSGLIEAHRMIKSTAEVALIRQSIQINSDAYQAALRTWKPGVTEADLAAEIDYRQRRLGAEGPSFDPIVASGPRSALPHARPSHAPILPNALLLVDMGALYGGYSSDMTRVVHTGKPTRRAKQFYQAVLESQLAAIDAVRDGVTAASVDRAARESLRNRNLDDLFTHSTGHGLGLEIHEGPGLRKNDRTVLRSGMAITIEPGVYSEGFGGVRIEDVVLVTPTGCEVLTPTPKDWIEI